MSKKNQKSRYTAVSVLHMIRLIYRSALFLGALIFYIMNRVHADGGILEEIERTPVIIYVLWTVFVFEMILRFFPSRFESPGCQKQFAKNYIKSGETRIGVQDNNAAVLVALIWISFNGIFGALHMSGVVDDNFMVLMSAAFSVCDMICILFFCPFQVWFLKNKCCCTCRIYNWDYAMMFTPLFFVRKPYAWSLLALSIGLLVRWEVTFFLHPERFSDKTNDYLRCSNCTEKLCAHKRQLEPYWKRLSAFAAERVRRLKK